MSKEGIGVKLEQERGMEHQLRFRGCCSEEGRRVLDERPLDLVEGGDHAVVFVELKVGGEA